MTTCSYCADGSVYDLWFTDGRWQQQRLGRCKHCAGGDCEPGRLVRAIAEHTGQPCVRVIFHALLGCMEYKIKHHEQARETELTEVLRGLYPGLRLELPLGEPEKPVSVDETPVKALPPTNYDFGDGFVREVEDVPF